MYCVSGDGDFIERDGDGNWVNISNTPSEASQVSACKDSQQIWLIDDSRRNILWSKNTDVSEDSKEHFYSFKKVVCGPSGQIWVITKEDTIMARESENASFMNIAGINMKDIDVSMNGLVWGVGTNDKIYTRLGVNGDWKFFEGNTEDYEWNGIAVNDTFILVKNKSDMAYYLEIEVFIGNDAEDNVQQKKNEQEEKDKKKEQEDEADEQAALKLAIERLDLGIIPEGINQSPSEHPAFLIDNTDQESTPSSITSYFSLIKYNSNFPQSQKLQKTFQKYDKHKNYESLLSKTITTTLYYEKDIFTQIFQYQNMIQPIGGMCKCPSGVNYSVSSMDKNTCQEISCQNGFKICDNIVDPLTNFWTYSSIKCGLTDSEKFPVYFTQGIINNPEMIYQYPYFEAIEKPIDQQIYENWICKDTYLQQEYQNFPNGDEWCKTNPIVNGWEHKFTKGDGICGTCQCCKRKADSGIFQYESILRLGQVGNNQIGWFSEPMMKLIGNAKQEKPEKKMFVIMGELGSSIEHVFEEEKIIKFIEWADNVMNARIEITKIRLDYNKNSNIRIFFDGLFIYRNKPYKIKDGTIDNKGRVKLNAPQHSTQVDISEDGLYYSDDPNEYNDEKIKLSKANLLEYIAAGVLYSNGKNLWIMFAGDKKFEQNISTTKIATGVFVNTNHDPIVLGFVNFDYGINLDYSNRIPFFGYRKDNIIRAQLIQPEYIGENIQNTLSIPTTHSNQFQYGGGLCTCPNGKIYYAGFKWGTTTFCESLDCFLGEQSVCLSESKQEFQQKKVECGAVQEFQYSYSYNGSSLKGAYLAILIEKNEDDLVQFNYMIEGSNSWTTTTDIVLTDTSVIEENITGYSDQYKQEVGFSVNQVEDNLELNTFNIEENPVHSSENIEEVKKQLINFGMLNTSIYKLFRKEFDVNSVIKYSNSTAAYSVINKLFYLK